MVADNREIQAERGQGAAHFVGEAGCDPSERSQMRLDIQLPH